MFFSPSHRLTVDYILILMQLYLGLFVAKAGLRLAVAVCTKFRNAYHLHHLPGPSSTIFGFGSVLDFVQQQDELFSYFHAQVLKYNAKTVAFPVSLFTDGSIFTTCAENVKHVLKTRGENYVKPAYVSSALRGMLGQSFVTINHQMTSAPQWKFQRKFIISVLNSKAYQNYALDVWTEECQTFLKHCATRRRVDLDEILRQTHTRAKHRLNFGVLASKMLSNFDAVFLRVQHASLKRILQPYYKYLGSSMSSERQLRQDLEQLDGWMNDVMDERVDSNDQHRPDFLSQLLLQLRQQEQSSQSKAKSNPAHDHRLTRREIRDLLMALSLASESTHATLCWPLVSILKHPHVYQKLQHEIDSVLGSSNGKAMITTPDQLKQMKYLDMCIWESLRLYPAVALNSRCAVADDTLPDGTFVPQGSEVTFSSWAMGRDAQVWPDALTYRPERWGEMSSRPSTYAFPVFNAGPRICPGQAMAILESKLFLSQLLAHFDLTLEDPTYNVSPVLRMTLTMKHGLPVICTPRPTSSWQTL